MNSNQNLQQHHPHSIHRNGFSLMELVVVIGLAVIILSLLVWRVARSRQSSRRMECESQLRNLHVALDSYHLQSAYYPIGTQNPTGPVRNEPSGYHHNWIEGLLPQLGETELYDAIDFNVGVYDRANQSIAETPPPRLICPADELWTAPNSSNYVGICSSQEQPIDVTGDGTFILNQPISQRDLTDGLNFVAIVGEKSTRSRAEGETAPATMIPVNWNSGTSATLRNLSFPINGDRRNDSQKLESERREVGVRGDARTQQTGERDLQITVPTADIPAQQSQGLRSRGQRSRGQSRDPLFVGGGKQPASGRRLFADCRWRNPLLFRADRCGDFATPGRTCGPTGLITLFCRSFRVTSAIARY